MYENLTDSQRRFVEGVEKYAREEGITLGIVTVRMRDCDDVPRFIANLMRFENKTANPDIIVGDGIKYAA